MFKKYLITIIFFSLIITYPCFAVVSDDELLKKIENLYRSYIDMKAEFIQESFNSTTETTKKASGNYFAKKPNLMRWEYIDPEEQYFLFDGKYLWFYTVEEKQVIKSDIQNTNDGLKMFLDFLSSLDKVKKDFVVTMDKSKTDLTIHLKAKNQMSGLLKLNVYLNPETLELKKTEHFDQFDNRNTIYFKKIKVNTGLKDEKFTFNVPKGVDVIEN